MNFARNISRDLVEKRLWPVALLLVVALVAIPVIGGAGSKAGGGEDSLPIAPGEAATASSAVQLLPPPSVRKRAGKIVDPFRRKRARAAGTESGPTNTGVGGTTAAPSGGASGGTTPDPSKSDGSPDKAGSTVDKSGPSAYDLTKVADVRFGKRGGTLKHIPNLAPLSELPSGADSIVLFAGALKGMSVARFIIVSDGGETTGSGECRTKNERCVSIDMEAGDTQLFRVDGVEYELQLVGINSVRRAGSTSTSGRAYRTRIRFGSTAAATERSITRLAALGGSDNPALQYLGAYSDGKRAVFVLGPNASASSQGDCLDGDACRVIGLRGGERAAVRVSSRRYVLKVESVRRLTLSAKAAAAARARVADDGRAVLRNLLMDATTSKALGRFRYSTDRGTLWRLGS